MPEDGIPEGAISKTELAELAGLFDRFEFAFDPISLAAREAESAFEDKVRALFEERVAPVHADLPFITFRCRTRTFCREFLKRNNP